ncbi:hypothetical protein [Pseudonocardia zijingensis]|uniref:Peptidase S74 domain-containing protein n=1 Tax=Pseudonocardia zijingensis TaxID=153376 RepID=A0ABN1N8P1_9PSEU
MADLDLLLVGAGAWASGANAPAPAYPGGIEENDVVYAVVHNKPDTITPSTPADWTLVGTATGGGGAVGADTGPTRVTVFRRIAPSGGLAGTQTINFSGNSVALAQIRAYRAVDPGPGLAYSEDFGSYSISSASSSIGGTVSPALELAAKDRVLVVAGSPTDGPTTPPLDLSVTAVAASGAELGAITRSPDVTAVSATGNDLAVAAWDVPVTAGSSSTGPTITGTTSVSATGVGFALRVRAADASEPPRTVSPTAVPPLPAPPQPEVEVGFRVAPDAIPAPADPPPSTVVPGPVFVQPTAIAAPPPPTGPMIRHIVRPQPVPDGSSVYEPTVEVGIRPPLRVDFWALDDDRSILCPLPQPTGWDLSLIPGEDGAVQLEYPADGINFDVLDSRINRSRDLFIHIRTDGRAQNALGAILTARQGDEVSEAGTWTFTGTFLTALLREGWLPYNEADERGETHFTAATAGAILGWVLNAAQQAGFCTDLHWTFTDEVDSRGVPWPADHRMSPTFSPGETPHSIAQLLRQWGTVEFEVTTDLAVRLYVPDTVGVDHTQKDPPIVLRAGRDLVESPRRTNVADAATDLLVIGKDGVYVTLHDDSARARRGRNVGQVVSEGSLADQASATAYGTVELARRVWGVDEITHSLTFDPDHPTPLIELYPLDWVYSDTGGGFTEANRERISQLTISGRSDHYSGGVVLRDLIDERDVSLQQQIDRLKSGSTVIGTSAPENPDDGKPPAAPTGLVVASDVAYQVPGDPLTYAEVSAQWQAVTTNADGTPATDISGYRIRWAYLGFDQVGGIPSSNPGGEPLAWYEPEGSPTTELQLLWGNAEGGRDIGVQVAAVDRSGLQSEWSTRVDITTQGDNQAPPAPSIPQLSVWFRTIDAHYDGLGSAGETMPEDTEAIEVWFSQTAAFSVPATVSDPVEFDPALTTPQHVANLQPTGGTWNQPNIPVGVGWYVAFRAVDRTKNPSPLSPIAGPVTAQQLVNIDIGPDAIDRAQIIDGEIVRAKIADAAINSAKVEELEVGKLTAGTMTATVTLSGTFQTGTGPDRLIFDSSGIRLYRDGNVVGNWDATDGSLLITGTYRSGLSGQRIHIDPDGTMSFFATAGANPSRIVNEGNDIVWRGPLTSGKSGRLNVNTLGVGLNYSNEGNLLDSITSEIVLFDRRSRITAPLVALEVTQKFDSPTGNNRLQFSMLDEDGDFITRSGISYGVDGNGWGGFYGNDTGWKLAAVGGPDNDDGRFVVTAGNLSGDQGVGLARGWEVSSSEAVKEDIEDVRAVLDPLETIKNARARKFRYTSQQPDAPPNVGVIAEELPEELQRPYRNDAGERTLAVDLGSQVGVLWGAFGQVLDQEIVSTSAVAVLDAAGFFPPNIFPADATVEVAVTWESTPPAPPTGGFVQIHSSFVWAGRVTAWIKTGSVTEIGCTVVFKNISGSAFPTNPSNDNTRVSATVIGLGLYTPPYIPPED